MARTVAIAIATALAACSPAPTPADVVARLTSGDCHANDSHCAIDFGTLSSPRSLAFDVVNTGDEPAQIANVTAVGDPAFQIEQVPSTQLAAGASSPLVVSVGAPPPTLPIRSTLTILWRADGASVSTPNDAIVVVLTATGAPDDTTCPAIPACNFPDTAVGASATCTASLLNTSRSDFEIDAIGVDGAFTLGGSGVMPLIILPGQSASMPIDATPTTAGPNTGTLTIRCGTVVESTTLTINGT